MPTILILDEHGIFREGLCALVGSNVQNAEVIPANSLVDYISQSRTLRPFDLALLDPGQSGFNSIDAIRKDCEAIAARRLAIISALDSRKNILSVLGAGFHGFLPKRLHDDEILGAINDILAGRIFVPLTIAEAPTEQAVKAPAPSLPAPNVAYPKLTRRQREVLSLLVRGMSNKEIARALGIAESTTKIHTAALIHALGVRNRTEAAFSTAKLLDLIMQQPIGNPILASRPITHED
jgi:DNA-binding NarL/FixJ family response regulator